MKNTVPRCAKAAVALLTATVLSASAHPAWPLAPTPQPTLQALIPFARFQKDFKITAGKDQGRVVVLQSRPDVADASKSRITFGDYATVHLARGARGGLLLERLDLIKSRSYVLYDPALPVVDLETRAPFQRQTQYRMYALSSGRLKRSGRVTHTVRRIEPARFETPAGPVEGHFIDMEHRMEMEYLSELRIDLGLGCREDEGPVFGTGRYRITRLGLFSEIRDAAAGILSR